MTEAGSSTFVDAAGCRFACLIDGPPHGPLALCLHGYPDTPHTWRHVAPALADAGWRAVRPFLRGYAPTTYGDRSTLGAELLGRDANALHAALGGDERAVLVGHDWGAAAAYAASGADPARWSAVIAASWPPLPAAIDVASFAQMRRSWYVMLFQLAEGERFVSDAAFIRYLWQLWSPHYPGKEDADRAACALGEGDGGTAVLALYRSLFGNGAGGPLLPRHPTLYLHGEHDGCIGVEFVDGLERALPPGSITQRVEGAGHFPQIERPEAFSAAVLDFLEAPRRAD